MFNVELHKQSAFAHGVHNNGSIVRQFATLDEVRAFAEEKAHQGDKLVIHRRGTDYSTRRIMIVEGDKFPKHMTMHEQMAAAAEPLYTTTYYR